MPCQASPWTSVRGSASTIAMSGDGSASRDASGSGKPEGAPARASTSRPSRSRPKMSRNRGSSIPVDPSNSSCTGASRASGATSSAEATSSSGRLHQHPPGPVCHQDGNLDGEQGSSPHRTGTPRVRGVPRGPNFATRPLPRSTPEDPSRVRSSGAGPRRERTSAGSSLIGESLSRPCATSRGTPRCARRMPVAASSPRARS